VSISRTLTAFHLDKLVDAGLLTARYEAPAGRPRGRGRTPKVYEVAPGSVAVTIPERHYELIGEILAAAVASDPADARTEAHRRAEALGHQIGAASAPPDADPVAATVETLADLGFEPRRHGCDIVVDNCPFHALAAKHTGLICGINHAFIDGVLHGLDATALKARLAPRPGACCIAIDTAAARPRKKHHDPVTS
jgi:predicted ArsR family transcriptional regulator